MFSRWKEPGLFLAMTKNGPSYFDCRLHAFSAFGFLLMTKSPSLICFSITFLLRHFIVSAWYDFMFEIALSRSSLRPSFYVQLSSGVASLPVLVERCLTSEGRMASLPNISLNGVNFVALDFVVLWD